MLRRFHSNGGPIFKVVLEFYKRWYEPFLISLVAGTWNETKKCITGALFIWTRDMIMCRLRIQKNIIGPLKDSGKRPKTWPGLPKNGPNFFGQFLSKGRLHPWAKYSEPKKQIAKIFFLLGATGQWSWNKSGRNGEDPKGLNGFWQKMAPKFFLASPVTVLAVSQNPPTSRFWSFGFLIYTLLCANFMSLTPCSCH